jgi:alanyl-tRNA synthetase
MAKKLAAKAKDNQIFEIVNAERKELIEVANDLMDSDPKLTVILANQSGDIIGMSRTRDMTKTIREISQRAGGSGGGKPEFAQGKVSISKLLKIIEKG